MEGPDSNIATVHSYLEVPTAVTYLRYEAMLNRLLQRLLRQYHAIRSDESWIKISQSDCPYIQQEVAEQPAEEAAAEQQATAVEERSPESAAPPETEEDQEVEPLATVGPEIEAKIAKLPRIPYNEYAVQSRVAAYDARQRQYGWG